MFAKPNLCKRHHCVVARDLRCSQATAALSSKASRSTFECFFVLTYSIIIPTNQWLNFTAVFGITNRPWCLFWTSPVCKQVATVPDPTSNPNQAAAAFVWVSGRFCTWREPHSSREGRSSSEQPKHFGTLGRVAHFVLTRVRPNGVRDALLSKFGALFAKFKVLRHHLYCLTTCRYRIGTHPGPSSAENSSVKKKKAL